MTCGCGTWREGNRGTLLGALATMGTSELHESCQIRLNMREVIWVVCLTHSYYIGRYFARIDANHTHIPYACSSRPTPWNRYLTRFLSGIISPQRCGVGCDVLPCGVLLRHGIGRSNGLPVEHGSRATPQDLRRTPQRGAVHRVSIVLLMFLCFPSILLRVLN